MHDAAFLVNAEAAVALVAQIEKIVGLEPAQIVEVFLQGVAQRGGSLFVIVVGTAKRLGDDFVDDGEFFELIGVELESLGGFGAAAGSFQRIAAHPSGEITE